MVKFGINWTLCIGEVRKPRLPREESVYLFLGSTINQNCSLQQYAETPKQKHAGGFEQRASKSKRTLLLRKVKLKIFIKEEQEFAVRYFSGVHPFMRPSHTRHDVLFVVEFENSEKFSIVLHDFVELLCSRATARTVRKQNPSGWCFLD